MGTNGHRCIARLILQTSSSSLLVMLPIFSQDRCSSLGLAALGLSSRAGRRAEISPVVPPVLAQDKVVVGVGAHGIKYIGFVRDLEL